MEKDNQVNKNLNYFKKGRYMIFLVTYTKCIFDLKGKFCSQHAGNNDAKPCMLKGIFMVPLFSWQITIFQKSKGIHRTAETQQHLDLEIYV